jgi:hypothetical protein
MDAVVTPGTLQPPKHDRDIVGRKVPDSMESSQVAPNKDPDCHLPPQPHPGPAGARVSSQWPLVPVTIQLLRVSPRPLTLPPLGKANRDHKNFSSPNPVQSSLQVLPQEKCPQGPALSAGPLSPPQKDPSPHPRRKLPEHIVGATAPGLAGAYPSTVPIL